MASLAGLRSARLAPRRCGALAVLLIACASYPRASAPAAQPLTPPELAAYELTVGEVKNNAGEDSLAASLRAAVTEALTRAGFRVVDHPPFRSEWELSLTLDRSAQGLLARATLRSDGFYVSEAQAEGADPGELAQKLVASLAVSQGVADFVRNSGTPQQRQTPMLRRRGAAGDFQPR
jgi:hypothetical protein